MNQGSAYVFVRSGTTWTQQAKLTASDGSVEENFGQSVAISGNLIVVGTEFGFVNGDYRGAAYIYRRSGTTWTEQAQQITVPDIMPFYGFGRSVAISGSDIIVGASEEQIGANIRQGAAYIFRFSNNRHQFDFDGDGRSDVSVFRPSNGVWYLQQSTNGFTGIQFGRASDKITPADSTATAEPTLLFSAMAFGICCGRNKVSARCSTARQTTNRFNRHLCRRSNFRLKIIGAALFSPHRTNHRM